MTNYLSNFIGFFCLKYAP
jgi:Na+-driven multidrug efflux pump